MSFGPEEHWLPEDGRTMARYAVNLHCAPFLSGWPEFVAGSASCGRLTGRRYSDGVALAFLASLVSYFPNSARTSGRDTGVDAGLVSVAVSFI